MQIRSLMTVGPADKIIDEEHERVDGKRIRGVAHTEDEDEFQ